MSKPLTVAVIGAGPAGLTTSKSMLAAGLTPTLFDPKPCVGGLWANAPSTSTSITVERIMRTNESKYTCSFSDFGYDEEESGVRRKTMEVGNAKEWNVFPTAEEVGNYLDGYARRFLVGKGCKLKLQSEATKIEKLENIDALEGGRADSDKPRPRWRVHYRDLAVPETVTDKAEEFDFLAICSGFNTRAYIPELENESSFDGDTMHTSEYNWKRVLSSCARCRQSGKHKIVVIGGSISGAETTAEIAIEISSLPEEEREKFELIHVFPRPFWVLPRYLPVPQPSTSTSNDGSHSDAPLHPPHFLPLDLLMYDLRRRTPVHGSVPKSNAERYRLANEFIKSLIDTDQSDYSSFDSGPGNLTMTEEAMEAPPWVAVSDSYAGFVREGRVKTMLGRVKGFGEGPVMRVYDTTRRENEVVQEIRGVGCVVMATGYTPATMLREILPQDIASSITGSLPSPQGQEQDFTFLPILLYNRCLHPSLSRSAGFVGMYKGPYFAGLELQGRWLAELFAGKMTWPSNEEMERGIAEEKAQREEQLKLEGLARSQRARAGYVDMVLDMCKRLGIPQPHASQNLEVLSQSLNISPLLPAHLLSSPKETKQSLARFVEEIAHSTRFVPVAVFRALHGKWSVSRTITSSTPSPMDGTFFGTARFIPRKATFLPGSMEKNKACGLPFGSTNGQLVHIPPEQQSSESATAYEYLYHEDGELTTNSGKVLSARRSYIYRLTLSPEPSISAYFVKRDRTSADYFFHELEFYEDDNDDDDGGGTLWKAKGEHLCSADWYWPEYMFHFGGVELLDFEIGYKVKGPKKDYTTTATYWR